MIRKIRTKRPEFSVFFCLLAFFLHANGVCAVQEQLISYYFETGKTYLYQLETISESRVQTQVSTMRQNAVRNLGTFKIEPIGFQNDSFIIDIVTDLKTLRRYIRANGQIAGAPAEAGKTQPFFLTFPEKPLKVGKKHQSRTTLTLGKHQIPTVWSLLLKSIDNDRRQAEIWVAASTVLPEDRLRKKKFSLKGKLLFDLELKVIQSATWTTEYSFSFINREIAVSRPLWNMFQKTTYNLELKEAMVRQ